MEDREGLPRWWVWKFGGSSLRDSVRIRACARLVADQVSAWDASGNSICDGGIPWSGDHLCVTVSAMGGVTSRLQEILDAVMSEAPDPSQAAAIWCDSLRTRRLGGRIVRLMNALYELHVATLKDLVPSANEGRGHRFLTSLAADFDHILNCLESVQVTRDVSACDYILGFGEVWSHALFSVALETYLGRPSRKNEASGVCQTPTLGESIPTEASTGVEEAHELADTPALNVITPIDSRDVIVSMNWLELNELQSVAADQLNKIADATASPAVDHVPKLTDSFLPCMSRTDLHRMMTDELNGVATESKQSTYTLESAPLSMNPTPIDTTPVNGTLFDKWPLPRPAVFSKDFWPVLNPSVNHNAFPGINFKLSYSNLYQTFHRHATKHILDAWRTDGESHPVRIVMVCPGFVCRRITKRVPGHLGRNGSDTSAVAYAVLLRAEGCTIWSDVDGIFSADPRVCPDAILLKTLSYAEALELASFGAKVLHPACLIPAMHFRIPLLLKNTFKPQNPGTLITGATFKPTRADHGALGKTVTRLPGVTLLTVHNQSFVPHFLTRLFTAAESASGGEHLLFVSQTTTSSAITLGIPASDEDGIVGQLVKAFKYDVTRGAKIQLNIDRGCTLLCVTGQNQMGYVGALAAWCEALAEQNVSIKAISQSSNEISTCFAVRAEEEEKALQGLHARILSRLVG